MKINNNIWLLAILLIGFSSCESDDDSLADPYINETENQTPTQSFSSGSADFSTFVAIGNSLTAGYSDGALFAKGQEVSFPNILANQFALAGGGNFTQPLMNDDNGGLLLNSTPIAAPRLIFNPITQTPAPVNAAPTTDITNILTGPFNNMGVPGAKSFHLAASGYGNIANFPAAANPYYVRMASSPNSTVIADAVSQNPTFFSLWIGNNDVLSYATSGGVGVDHNSTGNIDPATYGSNDITNSLVFDQVYNGLLQALSANGTVNGIVSNIPSVTDAPYFTTVPHNPIPMDATTAAFLNSSSAYGAYNAGIVQAFAYLVANTPMTQEMADLEIAKRTITFAEGEGNAVVIMDESLTDLTAINPALISMRQATAEDLIVLPASSFIGTEAVPGDPTTVNGVAVPLADQWVLIPSEQTEIANATAAFNQTIEALATQYDLAFFDVNTFFNEVATSGYQAGSAFMTADYVTGGTFSLDGIHPSPRGYAVIANQMINIINTKYGSNLPTVNPVDYTGLYLD